MRNNNHMTNPHSSILLVDDDTGLLELLAEYLRVEGFDVSTRTSGELALAALAEQAPYHAVVLDIMMPGLSGLDVLKTIRQRWQIPVIMLTGRGDDIDKIIGLELGADDYLSKPCNPRELSARIKAVLRRSQNAPTVVDSAAANVTVDRLLIDGAKLTATVDDQVVPLTGTEFKTLQLLCEHVGETLGKEALTETVLQRKLTQYDRSMDVHISRIRHKLAQFPDLNIQIKSLRGVGYQLVELAPNK